MEEALKMKWAQAHGCSDRGQVGLRLTVVFEIANGQGDALIVVRAHGVPKKETCSLLCYSLQGRSTRFLRSAGVWSAVDVAKPDSPERIHRVW